MRDPTGIQRVFGDESTPGKRLAADWAAGGEAQRLRQASDLLGAAMLVLNDTGHIIDINEHTCNLLNLPREHAIGTHYLDMVASSMLVGAAAAFLSLMRNGSYEGPMPLQAHDGLFIELNWRGKANFVSGLHLLMGSPIGAEERERDNVLHAQNERALRESEERFRSVVNHVIEAIITIDEHAQIQTFNPAAEKMFGYTDSEVAGKNVSMLMPEPYRTAHDRYVGSYLRTGEKKIIGIGREIAGLRKDGSTFPMYLAVSEFQTSGGRFFTGILRDITEQKNMETALRERAERLAAADRQKDEFMAMLAHELRNPLAPLRNALHILNSPGTSPQNAARAKEMMQRQVQHMSRLVDDLLDVSRIVKKKVLLLKERVDLSALLKALAEDYRPAFENSGILFTWKLPASPLWTLADAVRLRQAVGNLLHNANKFTDRGGHVTLELGLSDKPNVALITVGDTGIGLDRDMLTRIFETYAQAHARSRERGGLGLGLTLTKGLVELHGGRISASSEGRGRGSRFTVEIPLEHADVPSTVSTPQSHAPAAPRRILVIEDDADIADSMRMLLEFSKHQVEVAYNGPAGVQLAQRFKPEIVLCDIGLPGMDGYAVARALRTDPELAGTRLIALTGYGQDEDQRRAHEAGFAMHLVKPFDPARLEEIVARI